ncbi:MAG: hypothetical protein LH615_10730 [Ferruginibacter sp.]|nr:hypothetical protein [Ferruginibacter sp.]
MDKNDQGAFNEYDDSLITPAEKAMLDEILRNDPLCEDEIELNNAKLDNTDNDGDLLNEKSSADDATGEDLDIPGAGLDDADEAIGEEDEENNGYSQADTK